MTILIRKGRAHREGTHSEKPRDNRGRDCSHASTSHGTLRDPRRRQKLEGGKGEVLPDNFQGRKQELTTS